MQIRRSFEPELLLAGQKGEGEREAEPVNRRRRAGQAPYGAGAGGRRRALSPVAARPHHRLPRPQRRRQSTTLKMLLGIVARHRRARARARPAHRRRARGRWPYRPPVSPTVGEGNKWASTPNMTAGRADPLHPVPFYADWHPAATSSDLLDALPAAAGKSQGEGAVDGQMRTKLALPALALARRAELPFILDEPTEGVWNPAAIEGASLAELAWAQRRTATSVFFLLASARRRRSASPTTWSCSNKPRPWSCFDASMERRARAHHRGGDPAASSPRRRPAICACRRPSGCAVDGRQVRGSPPAPRTDAVGRARPQPRRALSVTVTPPLTLREALPRPRGALTMAA
jgi:hypothetical protein